MSIYTATMRTLALTVCTGSALLFAGCMGSAEPAPADPAEPAAAASAAPASGERVGEADQAVAGVHCPPTGLLSPTGGPDFPGLCNPLLPPSLQALIDGALTDMIVGCAGYCGQSTAACVSPLNQTIVSSTTFCFNQDGFHRYIAACVCDP